MIPLAQIIHWRTIAPWPDNMQVEQDLILSRIIVEIFSDPLLNKELAFRGGTALHKLFFTSAARYSEDIDLVRTSKGPISEIANVLRDRLAPWLGKPKTDSTAQSFKMKFYFHPENSAAIKLRLKIEINIEETFSILERESKDFSVKSPWFLGQTKVNTFHFNELMATKLRALYQRNKGRDVFDLWLGLKHKDFNATETVRIFLEYMKRKKILVTCSLFNKNLDLKLKENSFLDDISTLLPPSVLKSVTTSLKTSKENKKQVITEKWNLKEATQEIRNKILVYLS